MKIAVTAAGTSLESPLDPRFGRCEHLLVVETEDLTFEAMANPNGSRDSAAGIQTAQMVAEKGARIVLTGNCGPNAYQALSAGGLAVIVGCSGTVREVIENFKAGRYSHSGQPNVAGHFGASSPASPDAGPFVSPGMGMGRGQRGGMGRGMGHGMGRGGGGGAPMGRGRGRGPGARQADAPASAPSPLQSQPTPHPQSAADQELATLKTQAEAVEQQLAALNERIGQIAAPAKTGRLLAVVDANQCAGCGLCMRVCPAEAIRVNGVAKIDASCTGCGECVAECPQEAISLRKAQRT